jgi:hypothetical protein
MNGHAKRLSWAAVVALALLAPRGVRGAEPAAAPEAGPAAAPPAATGPTSAPSAEVSLQLVTEDGEKLIRAVVTSGGKPVENATVSFGVKRTFGTMKVGEDHTLDDGSAAARFPADLPGGPTGELEVVAQVEAPAQFAPARAEARFEGAKKFVPAAKSLPRALWARRAPYALMAPIVVLLAGVWSAYAFVVSQILAIRKGVQR